MSIHSYSANDILFSVQSCVTVTDHTPELTNMTAQSTVYDVTDIMAVRYDLKQMTGTTKTYE